MPDHVPRIDGRDPSGVAFAYCYGYIQALLDALVPRPWLLPTILRKFTPVHSRGPGSGRIF